MLSTATTRGFATPLQQSGGIIPKGTRVEVFSEIYWVFLALGTLVGVVVIGYMLYNAYKYREGSGNGDEIEERPVLGELPTGGGGGKKLFLSFGLSTIIVISLIVWTYGTLLYVEQGAAAEDPGGDRVDIEVTGYQFGWEFEYPNGNTTDGVLRVPKGTQVHLTATSRDVFHNFGIPAFKVKTDAIPGHQTDTWFIADRTGEYMAQCYELCGQGHSFMTARVIVMEEEAYEEWYANTTADNATTTPGNGTTTANGGTTATATGGGGDGN